MRAITIEEHFWTEDLSRVAAPEIKASPLDELLLDLGERRLAEMDANAIDVQVIGHTVPAAQGLRGADAIRLTRQANDALAVAVRSHPTRFAGWATLPTDDAHAAVEELERAVGELGFVGAMVNSTLGTNGVFLDDPQFDPLFAALERLDVPLYLHPGFPPPVLRELLYSDLPEPSCLSLAAGAWGWHSEVALHLLRLVLAGVFERYPNLRVVIGHGGEMLPFMLRRIDDFLAPERGTGLQDVPSAYLLRNVWITTSAMTALPPVMCALQVFGVDRVLFSVDYPYTPIADCRAMLDALPISPADKAKVAVGNAAALLGLDAWSSSGKPR